MSPRRFSLYFVFLPEYSDTEEMLDTTKTLTIEVLDRDSGIVKRIREETREEKEENGRADKGQGGKKFLVPGGLVQLERVSESVMMSKK